MTSRPPEIVVVSVTLITGFFFLWRFPVPHGVRVTAAAAAAALPSMPAPTAEKPQGVQTVVLPILVYHIVRPSFASDSKAVKQLAVTPEIFDEQLAHLRDAGYTVVGFHDLEAYFASSTPLPKKPIILSVDDGWSDQYTYAFPILKKYSDSATFFVFTHAIGRPHFLTWAQLSELIASGMTVGDHTSTHPYLTKITDPRVLEKEISDSKAVLENHLGVPVTEFAYPFGAYNDAIIALVKAAGYKSARGDGWKGNTQTVNTLYTLSAMNAPTSLALFKKYFP